MAVFGGLCEHILRTGATSLAAELFAVRGVIDYAHLSAAEATAGETSNVYVAKNPGKRWKIDYPPPRPSFNCGARHWRSECPWQQVKDDQASSRKFPRREILHL